MKGAERYVEAMNTEHLKYLGFIFRTVMTGIHNSAAAIWNNEVLHRMFSILTFRRWLGGRRVDFPPLPPGSFCKLGDSMIEDALSIIIVVLSSSTLGRR